MAEIVPIFGLDFLIVAKKDLIRMKFRIKSKGEDWNFKYFGIGEPRRAVAD